MNSRDTAISRLPDGAINITLDGVNVQDNSNRAGDGFFMYIRPLMDSVEEINVTSTWCGGVGFGIGQIRMTTRSGSNRFTGSAYALGATRRATATTSIRATRSGAGCGA